MKLRLTPEVFKQLTPVSATISRLSSLMNDVNAKTADITRVIELDAVLTVNVLRWANSSYYRARVPADNVRAAVVRLGMNNIIRLSIGNCLATAMRKAVPGYGLDENGLWRHNVMAALSVEAMETIAGCVMPPAAFTAALLHDVGKHILGQHLDPPMIAALHRLIREEKYSFIEAERSLLETDHAEVGAAMASYWKFPEEMIFAIEKHHNPDAGVSSLLDIVMIANLAAKQAEATHHYTTAEEHIGPAMLERQQLTPEKMNILCEHVATKWAATESEWSANAKEGE